VVKLTFRVLLGRILFGLAVFLVLAGVLIPYLWMVSGSFKTTLDDSIS